jgi:hypothetical protein
MTLDKEEKKRGRRQSRDRARMRNDTPFACGRAIGEGRRQEDMDMLAMCIDYNTSIGRGSDLSKSKKDVMPPNDEESADHFIDMKCRPFWSCSTGL